MLEDQFHWSDVLVQVIKICGENAHHRLTKEWSPANVCLFPSFVSISCTKSKFTVLKLISTCLGMWYLVIFWKWHWLCEAAEQVLIGLH